MDWAKLLQLASVSQYRTSPCLAYQYGVGIAEETPTASCLPNTQLLTAEARLI